jgi:hypothetical protein
VLNDYYVCIYRKPSNGAVREFAGAVNNGSITSDGKSTVFAMAVIGAL